MAGDEEALTAAKQARAEERLKGMQMRAPSARGPEGGQSYPSKGKKGKGSGKGRQEDGQKGKTNEETLPKNLEERRKRKKNFRYEDDDEDESLAAEDKVAAEIAASSSSEQQQSFTGASAPSFTFGEVESLIEQARQGAMSMKGSPQPDQAENSQGWRLQLRTLVSEFFSTLRDTGRKVGDVGPVILKIQDILGVDPHCRPLTTSGKRSLYPLPTPDLSGDMANRGEFLQATVQALNSLHGCLGPPRTVTKVAASALKRLQRVVGESPFLDEPLQEFSFSEFFKTKSLDYMGDEIKVAKSIVWEGVAASLPSQVGSLDIRDFCTGGVLHYINHVDEYLLPLDGQLLGKTPKTMVADGERYKVAHGLVKSGLCEVLVEKELYHIGSKPLLNGLFAVSKNEFQGDVELLRLIMNLKPLNQNTRALEGDTCTLPSITSLGAMFLDDDEMLCTSSEDIKCFFYLFRVPSSWKKYMGFGRPVPKQLLPEGCSGQVGYLVSRVLPMGYLNSVAIAQHIHRNVVRRCMDSLVNPVGGQQELRRDRVHSNAPLVFRVYLDNFDQLQKVSRSMALLIQGEPSPVVQQLRAAYEESGLPRHPGKSVQQEWLAEVQGALVNGASGQVCAKPSKFVRYLCLVLQVVGSGRASQRELQVIGGGLVYLCMFRRPLLCSLNALWTCIVQLEGKARSLRVVVPKVVIRELVRFVGLVPLAYMNLRSKFVDTVSASDASSTGGGFCLSRGITPYGLAASRSSVRGDLPEPHDFGQVLTVGLFDGIAALRVSTDILGLAVAGHISVEKMDTAQRVVEAHFPDTITVPAIEEVTEELVIQWSLRFSNVCLVLIGGGPPCQGVSGLNSDRRGALRDSRSSLFQKVPGIIHLFRKHFPWAQTHHLLESVGSMDFRDCEAMNTAFEDTPWFIDAHGITLAHRPRVYWVSWELESEEGVEMWVGSDGRLPLKGEVVLKAQVNPEDYLESGWRKAGDNEPRVLEAALPAGAVGRWAQGRHGQAK
eukprot:Skav205832  [mRNA]  locus=scaffold160:183177:189242:- [translate_table: standard]